jgi:GDPmannose 4,6-dehydratase
MQFMLAQDSPTDYVIGTGVTHSVEKLVDTAFRAAGLNWRDHVVTDAAFIRPAEVDRLCADPAKARDELGWEPKIGFEELVAMMVDADTELLASSGGVSGEEFATDSW